MDNIDLGAVSAYALAVAHGYEGTEEEWAMLQAESGQNAKAAEEAAALAQSVMDSIPEDYNVLSETVEQLSEMVKIERSDNLFNKDAAISGGYYDQTSGRLVTFDGACRCLIRIEAGTYNYAGSTNLFGTSAALYTIPTFNKVGEFVKSITGAAVGTTSGGIKVVTYTVTEDDVAEGVAYAGYSLKEEIAAKAMYVKSDTYPTSYIEYAKWVEIPGLRVDAIEMPTVQANPLYGKKVVFDGDSICYGGGSSETAGGGGWAKRIGNANEMYWSNVGVSGGTITSEVYASGGTARHWLSTNIDTIHAEHPELDYLILEGGTNDADILTSSRIGTFDQDDYSGEYDATTFFGALDTLFHKAASYYPHAKIGFVIAQKMGPSVGQMTKRRAYFDRVVQACEKWGIPYIDLWQAGQLNPMLTSYYDPTITGSAAAYEAGKAYYDGQHMTGVGYDIITPKIEAWMRTL